MYITSLFHVYFMLHCYNNIMECAACQTVQVTNNPTFINLESNICFGSGTICIDSDESAVFSD